MKSKTATGRSLLSSPIVPFWKSMMSRGDKKSVFRRRASQPHKNLPTWNQKASQVDIK